MKRARPDGNATAGAGASSQWSAGLCWLLLGAAAVLGFLVYAPALDGPFVLDDNYLHFGRTDAAQIPIEAWMSGRPVTGLTYYLNYQSSSANPGPYHVTSLLLHVAVTALVFLILRRALAQVPAEGSTWPADWVAAVCAGVFLLHPLQTEAVAYIAGRSDVLATLFAYAAIWLFLRHRRPGVGFGAVAAILGLALLALLSKQLAVAVPAVLILMDLLWHDGSAMESLKRNVRLHGVLLAGAVAGAAWVMASLAGTTAGFTLRGIAPVEYFLTQCRVIWEYILLLLLPVGQNADPDVAVSRSLADPFALVGLAGLLALAGLAVWLRRSRPLTAAGILIFLALLAPTSSFVPIQDVMAERRVYFAFLGPLLILADALRRWRLDPTIRKVAAGVLLAVLAYATAARATVWGDELVLWQDTVKRSPAKLRPRFQLAHLHYRARRCGEAVTQYAAAAKLAKPTVELLVDWGLALDCANRGPEAISRLREALTVERSYHPLAQLGMLLAKQGSLDEALPLLNEAVAANPREPAALGYRGNVLASQGKLLEAAEDFRKALALDPENAAARQGLRYVEQRIGSGR